jgi:hypothetical protein
VPKAPSSEGAEVSFLRKRQSRKGISGLPLLGKRHPRGTAGTPRLRPRTLNQTFPLPRLTDERSPLSARRVRAFVLPKKADETSTPPARPTRRSLSQDFPSIRCPGSWASGAPAQEKCSQDGHAVRNWVCSVEVFQNQEGGHGGGQSGLCDRGLS